MREFEGRALKVLKRRLKKMQKISGGVAAPKGFTAGGIHCGVRGSSTKKDLAMIYSETPCTAAAVYTQNKV